MKLPQVPNAIIPPDKLVGYLLSETHRDGRHKAAFFRSFGFNTERSDLLEAALLNVAAVNDVIREESSPFGRRFVVDGIMNTPDGRTAFVRTIWFIENDEVSPRFVTAYPAPVRRS